jgi:hypothetical protein
VLPPREYAGILAIPAYVSERISTSHLPNRPYLGDLDDVTCWQPITLLSEPRFIMVSCEVLQTTNAMARIGQALQTAVQHNLGGVGIGVKFCHIISQHCLIRTVPDSDPIRRSKQLRRPR